MTCSPGKHSISGYQGCPPSVNFPSINQPPTIHDRSTDSEGRQTGREPMCKPRNLNLNFGHHYHTMMCSKKNAKCIAFNLITLALRGKSMSSRARLSRSEPQSTTCSMILRTLLNLCASDSSTGK